MTVKKDTLYYRDNYLDKEEMDPERRQTSRQFDIFSLGVDFGRSGQSLVFLEDLLFDFVRSHPRLRQKLF